MQDMHSGPSLEDVGDLGIGNTVEGWIKQNSHGWSLGVQHLPGWKGYVRYGKVLWVSGRQGTF